MTLNPQIIIAIIAGLIILAVFITFFRVKKQKQLRMQLIEEDEMDDELFNESFTAEELIKQEGDQYEPDKTLESLGFSNDDLIAETDVITTSETSLETGTVKEKSSKMKKFSHRKNDDLIVLNITAKKGASFVGYELLQVLLSAGFRYGDMSIFHRHQKASGQGKILFSLASAREPGIFDMNNMGAFSCEGLCLFMSLTGAEHNQQAFHLLLETAHQLAEELDGAIKDEKRLNLTNKKLKQHRERVKKHEVKFVSMAA